MALMSPGMWGFMGILEPARVAHIYLGLVRTVDGSTCCGKGGVPSKRGRFNNTRLHATLRLPLRVPSAMML